MLLVVLLHNMARLPIQEKPFYWKGYRWNIRDTGSGGPGISSWRRDSLIAPDSNGYLQLSLTNKNLSKPIGIEISSVNTGWGYGTYTFVVNVRLDTLHKSAVVGGWFLYDDDVAVHHNEIDFCEVSAWGENVTPIIGHNVYYNNNGDSATHSNNANVTSDTLWTHQITWQSGEVHFTSYKGEGTGGEVLLDTVVDTNVPEPAQEKLHFNVWVHGSGTLSANAPYATGVRAILRDFTFVPI